MNQIKFGLTSVRFKLVNFKSQKVKALPSKVFTFWLWERVCYANPLSKPVSNYPELALV